MLENIVRTHSVRLAIGHGSSAKRRDVPTSVADRSYVVLGYDIHYFIELRLSRFRSARFFFLSFFLLERYWISQTLRSTHNTLPTRQLRGVFDDLTNSREIEQKRIFSIWSETRWMPSNRIPSRTPTNIIRRTNLRTTHCERTYHRIHAYRRKNNRTRLLLL